jgi:hypothetical protein
MMIVKEGAALAKTCGGPAGLFDILAVLCVGYYTQPNETNIKTNFSSCVGTSKNEEFFVKKDYARNETRRARATSQREVIDCKSISDGCKFPGNARTPMCTHIPRRKIYI